MHHPARVNMSPKIIYITGHTACGKGTLGKMLAARFGFHHISLGDVRRDHLKSLREGIPSLNNQEITDYVQKGDKIPKSVLARYDPVPAVLIYYNHRTRAPRTWSLHLATVMLEEELARVRALEERERGAHGGIVLVDGHPLSAGVISSELFRKYLASYAGLTIVIESPRHVAKQRYIERARQPDTDGDHFEARMNLAERLLPPFLELVARHGEIVYSQNNGDMTIEEAHNILCSELNKSPAFRALI